jgi:hemoglobin
MEHKEDRDKETERRGEQMRKFSREDWLRRCVMVLLAGLGLVGLCGCGGGRTQTQNKDFFTSGSREADQRAAQRMAKSEQLSGNGEGAGEKGVKKMPAQGNAEAPGGTNKVVKAQGKEALFDRLGGAVGISNIVADFMPRALQDPRVNWERRGQAGGLFHHAQAVSWTNTPQHAAILEKHMVQFLALATGGPAHYEGKGIKSSHAGMHISNPEFDAAVGDLKASLDKLQIANQEQKELLAIVESTRPEIVEER